MITLNNFQHKNISINFCSGNTLAPTGQQYDKKSGQWFGALVKSSGDNGVVLVRKKTTIFISIYFFHNLCILNDFSLR